MNRWHKRRLWSIGLILLGLGLGSSFVLHALNQHIDLYYTPTQLRHATVPALQQIRVGGIVLANSVHYAPQGLNLTFVLTDQQTQMQVAYQGVLPALFREGQGVVVEGHYTQANFLQADQVLAKHDANYKPPGLAQ